jgi:glutamate/tyrosine decarboxylase-like PLP-dependent enzyme
MESCEARPLLLGPMAMSELWNELGEIIDRYTLGIRDLSVAPVADYSELRSCLDALDFDSPVAPIQALEIASDLLARYTVHTPHPRYFGLFNPAPTSMSIIADALVAAFNPQLAAWSHAPFAVSLEQALVRHLAKRFGFSHADGTFTSGGCEANLTAVLCALTDRYEEYPRSGLQSLGRRPTIYAGATSHHSLLKAARAAGLGSESVRLVATDNFGRMNVTKLSLSISDGRRAGFEPLMIVATAGATSTGAVDRLSDVADVAKAEGAWFHVDAAWGGYVIAVPELRSWLDGITRADSVTFDPHKMFSVPMGAGLFLTQHLSVLSNTFEMATNYMPQQSAEEADPYAHSLQWSRRFVGLKLFLSLIVAGWDGYATALRHQTAMGWYLRDRLKDHGWLIANDTPLPVVCFRRKSDTQDDILKWARSVIERGRAWISATTLVDGTPVLRACITNYRTTESDVDVLVEELDTLLRPNMRRGRAGLEIESPSRRR